MRRYFLGKVLQAFLTLVFVLLFNFVLFRVMPGDPATLLLRGTSNFNPDTVEQVRADLGLDKPLPQQFLTYAADTATLNFGESFFLRGRPAREVIVDRIGPTLLIGRAACNAARKRLTRGALSASQLRCRMW